MDYGYLNAIRVRPENCALIFKVGNVKVGCSPLNITYSRGEYYDIHTDYRESPADGVVTCIRGLLIPVPTAVGIVADGMSEEAICAAYTDLEVSTFVDPCVMLLRWGASVSSHT